MPDRTVGQSIRIERQIAREDARSWAGTHLDAPYRQARLVISTRWFVLTTPWWCSDA